MKKLLNQAWTIIMVTGISLLVWLYAEDANVKTYSNERVLIKFVPTGDGELLIEPKAADILISLSGSNGQFQQFLRGIGDKRIVEIPIAISPDQTSQTRAIDLRRELNNTALENLGLNLIALNRETIDVTVQRVVPVTLDVHVDTQGLNLDRDEAISSVLQVTFQVPASMATDALQNANARIDLTQEDLSEIEPGVETRRTLAIELPIGSADLPEGFEMRPSATNAVVRFRLVIETESFTIERLIVKLSGPASIGDRYVVRIAEEDQVLSNIEVQGPPAEIAKLRDNGTADYILATVELTNALADELAAGEGTITKPVKVYFINLPGVRLVSEPPRIPVQVRLREAIEAAP